MRTRILGLLFAVLAMFGLGAVVAPSASAAYTNNVSVENSMLSATQSFLVCGIATGTQSTCKYASRGAGMRLDPEYGGYMSTGTWFAQNIAAAPGQCFMHRERFKIAGSTATNDTPWANFCGSGPSGSWLNVDNTTRFWGMGDAYTIQIIG